MWLYPYSNKMIYLFALRQDTTHWILCAIKDWTFSIELALITVSAIYFVNEKTKLHE
jgi:hypothetical protein